MSRASGSKDTVKREPEDGQKTQKRQKTGPTDADADENPSWLREREYGTVDYKDERGRRACVHVYW